MKYKLVIFDFDGTLANSYPIFVGAFGEAIEHFGLRRLDPESLSELRSRSAREVIAYMGIPFWKVPIVARFVRLRMTTCAKNIQLFPGIEELLRKLRAAGVIISIVTSNSEANVRTILGTENAHLIDDYECGAALFGKAPRFRKVLKRLGIARNEAISIGDEIRDIEAAQKVGIAFGAVSWGYTTVQGLERFAPEIVFNSAAEIYNGVA